MSKSKTVEEYIKQTHEGARPLLQELRECLKKAAPDADEGLKWGMPSFSDGRILFTYAAFQRHVGFYPTPSAMKQFDKELANFKTGKGSVQFPLDEPLPKQLIIKIAKFRVKELKEKDAKWM